MGDTHGSPGLLARVFGKGDAIACPQCGGSEEVRQVGSVEIEGQAVTVYVCRDAKWSIQGNPFDKNPKRSCQYTGFGVLPDGQKTKPFDGIYTKDWFDQVVQKRMYETVAKTDAEVVAQAATAARQLIVRDARRKKIASARPRCINHTCADCGRKFQDGTEAALMAGGGR